MITVDHMSSHCVFFPLQMFILIHENKKFLTSRRKKDGCSRRRYLQSPLFNDIRTTTAWEKGGGGGWMMDCRYHKDLSGALRGEGWSATYCRAVQRPETRQVGNSPGASSWGQGSPPVVQPPAPRAPSPWQPSWQSGPPFCPEEKYRALYFGPLMISSSPFSNAIFRSPVVSKYLFPLHLFCLLSLLLHWFCPSTFYFPFPFLIIFP
jgi:hypothetical protein